MKIFKYIIKKILEAFSTNMSIRINIAILYSNLSIAKDGVW